MYSEPATATHYREDISAQSRMPFPFVTGGIGLLLALVSPGGLSGGQGFLIGFTVGILAPGIITGYSMGMKARQARLTKEVERALAELQAKATRRQASAEGTDERSGEIGLGEGAR